MIRRQRRGFTIIELMLAMALLGTMMVAIATLIIHILTIYQKGLTMRDVSTVGREIVADITRVVNSSPTVFDDDTTINPSGTMNIQTKDVNMARTNYYNSTFVGNGSKKSQVGGVFCTGAYSYIWNTAETIRKVRDTIGSDAMARTDITESEAIDLTDDEIGAFVIMGTGGRGMIPRLARFSDPSRSACAHDTDYDSSGNAELAVKVKNHKPTYFKINTGINNVTELIKDNETDLALYHFEVAPATQNERTKQIFYSGVFILATIRGGVNIKSNGNYCEGESDNNEFIAYNFEYCAVNKFNFSARATGETGIYRNGDGKI